MTPAPRLLAILGPTASGKSAVAMAVAAALPAEIVSCDSMQVYRGLDIGTAKPTAAERQAVPHHLVDHVDLHAAYDVRRFLAEAEAAISEVLARGRWPILCGGTGLYAKALLYGFDLRPSDPAVRQAVQADLDADRDAVLAELQAADPARAALVAANDRYLVRAVEVLRLTGEAPTESRSEPPAACRDAAEFVLMPSAAESRRRIEARTHAMLAAGWIDEARHAIAAGLLETPTACQALGYRDIADYLEDDDSDLGALTDTLVTRTARYAKRQRTWFRNQHPRATTLPPGSPDALARTIIAALA